MMIRAKLAAFAVAGALIASAASAETQAAGAAAAEAFFASVENATPSAPLASEADYRTFGDAIGDRAVLTFGAFAPEAGGAVARDVVVTFGETKEAGLNIRELRLHKGGVSAAGDVEAERLEARGVTSFGLGRLIEKSTAAMTEALIKDVETADGGEAAKAPATTIDAYDIAFDRIVFDGMMLHAPDNKVATKDAGEFAGAMRAYAAFGRVLSARAMFARGMSTIVSTKSGDSTSRMTIAAPFYGLRGVARGDVEYTMMKNMAFSIDGESAGEEGGPKVPISLKASVDLYSISGLRVAKLLGYWSRGEMPSPKEADLISLGIWESKNERYELGGAPFYSLDYGRTDMTKFRWFAPTSISSTMKNLTYDLGGFMKFAASAAPASEAKAMADMRALLDKHGLSKITTSGDFLYEWSPETGAAKLVSKNDVAMLGRLDFETSAALPNFNEFASLYPKKGKAFDSAKLGALLADASFENAKVMVADNGVLTRGFAFAADMQALQAGAPAGTMKGPELRAAAAFGVRGLGAGPTALGPVYTAIADFVAEGGVLSLASSPASPIPLLTMTAPAGDGGDPLARFNLTAERKAE